MPGISKLTTPQFQRLLIQFPNKYIADWDGWIGTSVTDPSRPARFGAVLRKWQACRPNEMRRDAASAAHHPPYLDDLIVKADPPLKALVTFDISGQSPFTAVIKAAIRELWTIFRALAYQGDAYNGQAGAVGISKAVLLLSLGRVGPAFDKEVSTNLGIKSVNNADQWIDALKTANRDIREFERRNGVTLAAAAPAAFAHLPAGRLYDMALGPRD